MRPIGDVRVDPVGICARFAQEFGIPGGLPATQKELEELDYLPIGDYAAEGFWVG